MSFVVSAILALQKRKQSSANKRWATIGAPLQTFIPWISPLATALWIRDVRPSVTRMNR
jgi:hypothetical protein